MHRLPFLEQKAQNSSLHSCSNLKLGSEKVLYDVNPTDDGLEAVCMFICIYTFKYISMYALVSIYVIYIYVSSFMQLQSAKNIQVALPHNFKSIGILQLFSFSDSPFKSLPKIERYHFPGAHQLVLIKYSFKVFIDSFSSQRFKVLLPSVSKYFFKPTIERYCFPGAEKVAG